MLCVGVTAAPANSTIYTFSRIIKERFQNWLTLNYRGNGSLAAECSTITRTARVRAQLTAVACGLRQTTLPMCATWSGSEGYCMVE